MNEETKKPESWKEVIIDFFENRVATSKLYKARKHIDEKLKNIKSEKDSKKLEKLKIDKAKKQEELIQLRREAPATEIRGWIENTSAKKIGAGNRIVKATHVLKFSHGSSEAEGLLLTERSKEKMLTTASLKRVLTCDLAHNNGALITISRFLALKLLGNIIVDLVLNNDFAFLDPFYEDSKQLDKWKKGIGNLVEQREIKTTDKAKQIYFPLPNFDDNVGGSKAKYHLIAPLFSSSLAEEIYSVVTMLKYGKEQKEIRNCREEGGEATNKSSKYHPEHYMDIPGLGVQKFGGTQPQNISMLNKNRSGKCFLLSSQPPIWQNQFKPPINKVSLFDDGFFSQNSKIEINYLRDFLLRFECADLSIKNPERRKWIDSWVRKIIGDLLFYTESVQNMPAGWSNTKDIRLKQAHQYFLDPYRENETFQIERKAGNWQAIVCYDFARWLNSKLVGKHKKFTPQSMYTRMWIDLLEQPLREADQAVEAEINFQTKERA